MNKKIAQNLINKTRDDYNKISDHFASTRKKVIWPDVLESFEILSPEKGKKVLDLGSGSGRLFPLAQKYGLEYVGLDLSKDLVTLAKKEHPKGKFSVGDATNLPFQDNEFDYVISVAVLYHIPSKELREKALSEIYRVTKPNGKAYISIWYFWNKWKYIKLILSEGLRKILGKSGLDFGDFLLSWKTPGGEVSTDRYCHGWTLFGLKKGLKRVGFSDFKVVKGYKNRTRNLNIICKK